MKKQHGDPIDQPLIKVRDKRRSADQSSLVHMRKSRENDSDGAAFVYTPNAPQCPELPSTSLPTTPLSPTPSSREDLVEFFANNKENDTSTLTRGQITTRDNIALSLFFKMVPKLMI